MLKLDTIYEYLNTLTGLDHNGSFIHDNNKEKHCKTFSKSSQEVPGILKSFWPDLNKITTLTVSSFCSRFKSEILEILQNYYLLKQKKEAQQRQTFARAQVQIL